MEFIDLYNDKRERLNIKQIRYSQRKKGEYYILINAWIINSNAEILLTRRQKRKSFPCMWECTSGAVLCDEDSLSAAIREVKEEIGIVLDKDKFKKILTIRNDDFDFFCDVWVINQDIDKNKIKLN